MSKSDLYVVATGPEALEPPISSIPSAVATAAAPARASGSVRLSGAVFQAPSSPVVPSGVRTKVVVVGAPSAPLPPIT